MNAASVKEIKTAIEQLPQKELIEICLRLVKFKKESKELATYLLFEQQDESNYVMSVKEQISEMFTEVNRTNIYFAKKTIRKILRTANKFIRYSSETETEVAILMHVASGIQQLGFNLKKSTALENLYLGLIKKIKKALSNMHEDLQYDYERELAGLL